MHRIETRSLEKLTALDLETCFNWCDIVALPHAANQNMKLEECKYAEVRISQGEAELQTLVPARWLWAPFFPCPMEFINRDLGESFSLSLSCSAMPLLCHFYLLENYNQMLWFLDNRESQRESSFAADSTEHAIIPCACTFLPIITKGSC